MHREHTAYRIYNKHHEMVVNPALAHLALFHDMNLPARVLGLQQLANTLILSPSV